MTPSILIRKRYSPGRKETILELVRPRKDCKIKTSFWFCACGSRMHFDLLICSDCGRDRSCEYRLLGDEVEKLERTYESLRQELRNVEKDLKNVKKEIVDKTACDKQCAECKPKKERDRQCDCMKGRPAPDAPAVVPEHPLPSPPGGPPFSTTPYPQPPLGILPYPPPNLPPLPPQCFPPAPGPFPRPFPPEFRPPPPLPPEFRPLPPDFRRPPPPLSPDFRPKPPNIKPISPVQSAPAINVIVPECRGSRYKRRSQHRDRSPSVSSSSSTATNHSFERLKHRIRGLGRRVSTLEDREDSRDECRDEYRRLGRFEDEVCRLRRVRDAEETVRQREERLNDSCYEDEVIGWRRRNRGRNQGECVDIEPGVVRILPLPVLTNDTRRRYQSGFVRSRAGVGRWTMQQEDRGRQGGFFNEL